MNELVLNVKGMSCSGCEQRIEQVLRRLAGVQRASADHRSGVVKVVRDERRAGEDAVRQRIEQAGYEVIA